MKIHVCVAVDIPKRGSRVIAPCGEIIKCAAFPFYIDGDARTANLRELGNCFKCRRKLKIPEGKHLVYGLAERSEIEPVEEEG